MPKLKDVDINQCDTGLIRGLNLQIFSAPLEQIQP
jgi:hypothetical protein